MQFYDCRSVKQPFFKLLGIYIVCRLHLFVEPRASLAKSVNIFYQIKVWHNTERGVLTVSIYFNFYFGNTANHWPFIKKITEIYLNDHNMYTQTHIHMYIYMYTNNYLNTYKLFYWNNETAENCSHKKVSTCFFSSHLDIHE